MTDSLMAALKEIQRRTGMLMHQNTGRWDMRKEHDKRTVDVLTVNQEIASAALLSPPQAVTSQSVGRGALDDVKSHRSAWRSAIEGMIKLAEQQNPHKPDDDADLSYWQHELRAFDRTFDALSSPPPVGEQGEVAKVVSYHQVECLATTERSGDK